MPQNTDVCKECGHEYGIHSTDGERCPKNGGQLINGQLDFYATHFDDGLYSVDQLRARIAEITEETDRANLRIIAKDMQIAELTRMLFALGKQDGQTIRELTEENRGLRQMLHMEAK